MASTRTPQRSATVAVLLSFIWPGLGHAYQRRYRTALIYALPMIVVVGYLGLGLAQRGLVGMALDLFDPSYAQTVFVLGILLGIWRLVAMVDAWLFARRAGSKGVLATAVLALLAVLVIGAHGYVGYVSWAFFDAGSNIFVGSAGGDLPFPDLEPPPEGSPGASPTPELSRHPRSTRRTRAPTGSRSCSWASTHPRRVPTR